MKSKKDPYEIFKQWFSEADQSEEIYPEAMALSTVDTAGFPNVRMVLLKAVDQKGFVFYTNLGSKKGQELKHNRKAALCFYWRSISKQIRIRGVVTKVSNYEADNYFSSRPRDSQIGAWASKQSQILESRFALEKSIASYTLKHPIGKIPRPDFWSGFRINPLEIEFWQEKMFRLHDRLLFHRQNVDDNWETCKLYP